MPWVVAEKVPHEPLSKHEQRQIDEYLKKRQRRPRFCTDANFPEAAIALLRAHNEDVVTAKEAGLTTHSDEDYIAFASREKRVLLTCDRDFLDERKYPLHTCPAIVAFDFGPGTVDDMGQAFQVLDMIWQFPEMYDKWSKFDAKRDHWKVTLKYLDGTTSRDRCRFHNDSLQVWREETTS